MNSFFSGVLSNSTIRETTIKDVLRMNLGENAKEIQFEQQQQSDISVIDSSDTSSSLCTTIEAIFLHGLKDSFLRQTMMAFSNDIDRRPEPNFWPPLLIITHKQVIEHILSLNQITTDIGYCRAWIRQSLNDSLLAAYLSNIRKNQSALTPYYKKYAFLRDPDQIEVAESFIGGIEACVQFSLPINSSLLNQWTNHPLQMAGLYTPPLRSHVIVSGIDVANSLADDQSMTEHISIPRPLQTNKLYSESISNSPFANTSKQISTMMNKPNEPIEFDALPQPITPPTTTNRNDDDDDLDIDMDDRNIKLLINKIDENNKINEIKNENQIDTTIYSMRSNGNAIDLKSGWSTAAATTTPAAVEEGEIENKCQTIELNRSTSINSLRSPIDRHSYNSLLAQHECQSRTIDLKDVWERFEQSLHLAGHGIIGTAAAAETTETEPEKTVTESNTKGDNKHIEKIDFEWIGGCDLNDKLSIPELQQLVQQTCHIARENGIDAQEFICRNCPNPLSVGGNGAAASSVCAFSGYYYCGACMNDTPCQIPARIIYNWDFGRYPVSRKVAQFLTDFVCQPFIDLKLLNPHIYEAVDDMAAIQSLRIQLNFIRAYLFTCSQQIIEQFQRYMWTMEHLYEHIHQYSIRDLQHLQRDQLAQQLQKAVAFGREHILNCRLCSQKGFICEICSSEKVLYPFDIETTFRCEQCGAVFHDHCLDASRPCPKCDRRRKREDLPLLDSIHNQQVEIGETN